MKKIKAKLQTTSLIALAAMLLIVSMVQVAEAEPIRVIIGSDEINEITIIFDDNYQIITLQSEIGISEHTDLKVKTYKSGNFLMIGLKSGIIVLAHPIEDGQYELTVKTSGTVYRFIGESGILQDIVEQPITTQPVLPETNSTKAEPQSSIGSDLSKYDIPTYNPRSNQNSPILTITGMEHGTRYLNDKLDQVYRVYEVRDSKSIVGAEVTLEISRDGFTQKEVTKVTEQGGLVRFEIEDMVYPLFYPTHCYNYNIVATYGNLTATWEDNFVMSYPKDTRVWEPTFDWISEVRWNHLPESYRDEPRQTIWEDSRCN